MTAPKYIPILDPLRGLAAFSVCLFHFASQLPEGGLIREISGFGWLGVEVFFVISGFVIPYSLYRKSYRLVRLPGFLLSRSKRLYPPYIASFAVVFALYQAHSLLPGLNPLPRDWYVVSHLLFLNGFLGLKWLVPVYWSLAVELQFYIFLAFAFPLLVHSRYVIRIGSPLTMSVLGLLPNCLVDEFGNAELLTHWLPVFATGILSFQFYTRLMGVRAYFVCLFVCGVLAVYINGTLQSLAAVSTALMITGAGAVEVGILAPLAFMGTISYSLYLIHAPVGYEVFAIARRLPQSPLMGYLSCLTALVACVGCAWIFSQAIEKPAQRWAKSTESRSRERSEPQLASQQSLTGREVVAMVKDGGGSQ